MSARRFDAFATAASFARHKSEPNVSTEGHIRRLRTALGESLAHRHAMYLDTKYWIYLRDAHLDRPKKPEHSELLGALRELVAAGKVFCPLSASTFVELLKQSDRVCREATAQLVDDLGLGVALCDEQERICTEIAYLIYKYGTRRELYPLQSLVWVRLPFVLGTLDPRLEIVGAGDGPAIAKAFLDHLWAQSMTDIVARVGWQYAPPYDLGPTATRLNESNAAHAHELKSFEDTYCKEIEGALDLFTGVGIEVVERIFEETTGERAESTPESRAKHAPEIYGLLVGVARAGKGAEAFPTLHVQAKCHAANRWDQRRRLKANTLLDFHHAVAAVSYCDAFFTEKDMRAFLTAGHVHLDRELGCTILSNENEVLGYLRTIA